MEFGIAASLVVPGVEALVVPSGVVPLAVVSGVEEALEESLVAVPVGAGVDVAAGVLVVKVTPQTASTSKVNGRPLPSQASDWRLRESEGVG